MEKFLLETAEDMPGGSLEAKDTTQLATFLIDQALLQSSLRVGSASSVEFINLMEQAFEDVGAWLTGIHGGGGGFINGGDGGGDNGCGVWWW